MRKIILIAGLLIFPVLGQAKVVTEEVTYKVGDTTLKGYMAWDDSKKDKRPGIVVVHEWWGHNKYVRERARMLAELGYTAFALDMYGDGKVATHPKDAGTFSGAIKKNLPLAETRYLAALKVLRNHSTTDTERIAAVGYCFGGKIVLEMARRGVDLDGIVSVHGSPVTQNPAKKGVIKGKVLVLNGADDVFVKPESIEAFKKEMKSAKVDYKVINYKGARHAFTNPEATERGKKFNIPIEYNARADRKSWKDMKKFLRKLFD